MKRLRGSVIKANPESVFLWKEFEAALEASGKEMLTLGTLGGAVLGPGLMYVFLEGLK